MPWVTRYHRYDGQGNTRLLTDETGTATDSFTYDAWGNEVARTGTTETPFRWNGRVGYYWDEDSGTYQVRRRPYSPKRGRWLTVDPIWPEDGINTYLYAMNLCPNASDPIGLSTASEIHCYNIALMYIKRAILPTDYIIGNRWYAGGSLFNWLPFSGMGTKPWIVGLASALASDKNLQHFIKLQALEDAKELCKCNPLPNAKTPKQLPISGKSRSKKFIFKEGMCAFVLNESRITFSGTGYVQNGNAFITYDVGIKDTMDANTYNDLVERKAFEATPIQAWLESATDIIGDKVLSADFPIEAQWSVTKQIAC